MDKAITKPQLIDSPYTLSARQEQLLVAALNSNKPSSVSNTTTSHSPLQAAMSSGAMSESPLQAPGSGSLGFDESPLIDYDYEFDGEGSYDFDLANDSQGQMIGNLPGGSSDGDADGHDKRSLPDDARDDDEGGGKRRESEEKSSKKPGRKPLTSEPTSKRKAQNRAAQRAFRERKEKHLKDLETKVDDLEKASESANHENAILRAQIEKMSMEIREYRKRLSPNGNGSRNSSLGNGIPPFMPAKNHHLNNPNDVSFSFDFPKFGRLPGAPVTNGSSSTSINGSRQSASPTVSNPQVPFSAESVSPREQPGQSAPSHASDTLLGSTELNGGDMSSLSGLFSPSLLNSVGKDPAYDYFAPGGITGSISSTGNTSYSSPSASSSGNQGPSSSCGTSPEPSMQSPGNKAIDVTLSTIGEERLEGNAAATPLFDFNGIDWLAQQNGNQFDPQLFGEYRESQDNILSGDNFNDSFFTDALAIPDFTSPYNVAPSPAAPVKKSIVAQIDEKQNADEEVVPGEDSSKLLTCNTIWDRLQACPNVREGEFDLDLLCKDLQKKAKCSETGAVVNESDFNKILRSYSKPGETNTHGNGIPPSRV